MRKISLAVLVALATMLGSAAATGAPAAATARAAATAPAAATARVAATARAAAIARAAAAPAARELLGVSCVTTRNCLAVGQDLNAVVPLARTWNGTAWKVVAVKLPPKTSMGSLDRVTCRSATRCLAVGFFDKGITKFALGDWWNGKSWSPVQLPGAAGESTFMDGVSCPTATRCVVVGAFTSGSGSGLPLADIWNGSKWTVTKPAVPRGTIAAELSAVSCVSATFCVATGEFFTNSAGGVLIYKWNGKAWSRMAAVVPKGSTDGFATGVSCFSATMCFAVGSATGGKGLISVVERWNGSKWALTSVPWPGGTTNPELTGVSCVAANRCVAAGIINSNLMGASNSGGAAAAVWNGKAWAATPVPAPSKGKASLFNAVTCRSATYCVAVGQVGPAFSTNGVSLSGFWNGSHWRLVNV